MSEQSLFSLEVVFGSFKSLVCLKTDALAFGFRFSNFDAVSIDWTREPELEHNGLDFTLNRGQCCLFQSTGNDLEATLKQWPLYLLVVGDNDGLQYMVSAAVRLQNTWASRSDDGIACQTSTHALITPTGHKHGSLSCLVRLKDLGPTMLTHWQGSTQPLFAAPVTTPEQPLDRKLPTAEPLCMPIANHHDAARVVLHDAIKPTNQMMVDNDMPPLLYYCNAEKSNVQAREKRALISRSAQSTAARDFEVNTPPSFIEPKHGSSLPPAERLSHKVIPALFESKVIDGTPVLQQLAKELVELFPSVLGSKNLTPPESDSSPHTNSIPAHLRLPEVLKPPQTQSFEQVGPYPIEQEAAVLEPVCAHSDIPGLVGYDDGTSNISPTGTVSQLLRSTDIATPLHTTVAQRSTTQVFSQTAMPPVPLEDETMPASDGSDEMTHSQQLKGVVLNLRALKERRQQAVQHRKVPKANITRPPVKGQAWAAGSVQLPETRATPVYGQAPVLGQKLDARPKSLCQPIIPVRLSTSQVLHESQRHGHQVPARDTFGRPHSGQSNRRQPRTEETSFDFEHSLRQRPAGTIARFRPFHVQARYKQSRPTMSEETASVASVAAESLATISSEPTATIDSPRDPLSARSPPLQTAVESRPIVSALPVSALGDTNTRAVVNPPAIDPSPADDLAQWKQLASNYSTDVFDSDDDEEDDDARTSTTGSPSLPSASRPASRGTNSTYANNSVMHSTNSETSSSGGSSATSPSTTGHTTPMDTHASHPRVTAQLSHEEAVSRSHDYARAAQWDTLANSMTADGYSEEEDASENEVAAAPATKALSVLERIALARQALVE